MDARFTSGVLVALGLADVAGQNLLLAPKLALPPATIAPAAERACPPAPPVPPPLRAEAPAPRPALTKAALVEAAPAEPGRAEPGVEAKATDDVVFDLGGERVGSLLAVAEIQRVATELAADPRRRLVLRGHADRLGSPAQNIALSRRRAETILRLLMTFGAPADRISVEAAGDAEPVDTSDTPLGWARNRRVQLLWR